MSDELHVNSVVYDEYINMKSCVRLEFCNLRAMKINKNNFGLDLIDLKLKKTYSMVSFQRDRPCL